ncbi:MULTISPECIES: BrnT family toxin [Methylobacterium]|uniref:BrnT family toxin n=1 Tax=Methylobacterium thuringiense TaxID=1003091 RepID=A0ABQ4TMU2_9HYPH|nr:MULTISPECIES: BrnT family toxin [Methylobacterium]TXN20294.1 hypothetical protein FV217_18435 [Methylobacterium sp. WL9]GJE55417.1 hypothetical protein EKPJFOCH_1908 [Methylobacterium thuringiense]
MTIIYDESKRQANIAKHGFDFSEFEAAFSFDRFVTLPAKASRTGRIRFTLVGTWKGATVVVAIVSPLGTEAVSLVSIRHANAKERAVHDQA